MSTIEAQLKLEQGMVNRGVELYRISKESAIEGGRGAETGFARRLMDEYLNPLVEALENKLKNRKPGIRARADYHVGMIDADKAIFITLRNVFNEFQNPRNPVTLANNIGKMIEDEARFTIFSQKYKAYYQEIMDDFKKKGTKNYRYMHRVLTHSANGNEDGWVSWSPGERVDVGMRLLDIVLQETDLMEKTTTFKRHKTITSLIPTDAALAFIAKYDQMAELLHPRMMPCIIQPDPWTALDQGGYFSPELRSTTRLVLHRHPHHKRILKKTDLTKVMEAVNGAQEVAWKVNTKVLDVVRQVWAQNLAVGIPPSEKLAPSASPFPDIKKDDMNAEQLAKFIEWKREASTVYTAERERQGQCFQVTGIIRAANEYREYSKFWYVWTLDFRGRMYTTTSGFSPQGPDVAKGMLTFAEGKRLGERGVFWLKVHGANRYGVDKVDYDDRVKWVDDNHDFFMRAANDPMNNLEVWSKADKPYQFLAFLFEYKEMHDGRLVGRRCEDYVSYLPVGLDGSCNGLQHFSAMLRDSRGGRATNLLPAGVPSDIYREVADVCLNKLRDMREPIHLSWMRFADRFGDGKLPRTVAKRPVMTMPYGSTRQSCTTYIFAAVVEKDRNHFGEHGAFLASSALTPLLWSSIGEVVVAARKGMDWLQKCAGVMSKQGLGITWRTKDGFIVHMYERQVQVSRVQTQLAGRFQARVGDWVDTLDVHKQRNGVSPNFVHSQDAAHLRATVIRARAQGITSLALIHDDYGTHAADTDTLHRVIRECFVEQYSEFDPLSSFKEWCEAIGKSKLPPMPPMGDLDIEQVKHSKFFFG